MEVKTNLYNALYYHNASVFFYRGVMIILLLLILGCSDSNKVAKETNVSIDVINLIRWDLRVYLQKMAYLLNLYLQKITPIHFR